MERSRRMLHQGCKTGPEEWLRPGSAPHFLFTQSCLEAGCCQGCPSAACRPALTAPGLKAKNLWGRGNARLGSLAWKPRCWRPKTRNRERRLHKRLDTSPHRSQQRPNDREKESRRQSKIKHLVYLNIRFKTTSIAATITASGTGRRYQGAGSRGSFVRP